MKNEVAYELVAKWIVCIYINTFFLELLQSFSQGDVNSLLTYLFEKYKHRIMESTISSRKRTATAEYQPSGEAYVRKKIKIQPLIWQKYWELRQITGYSISYLIRIFLTWEAEERQDTEVTKIPLMRYGNDFRSHNNTFLYPYVTLQFTIKKYWDGNTNSLKIEYWDDS